MFHRIAKILNHIGNDAFDFVEIKCLLFIHIKVVLKFFFKAGLKY